ncbi:hypothetical protein [Isoptericola aurantiacus]|uniref:hypothetical protein n=1 Tax=Isoptericola aurantiacus TaxID=3377839 RepID=UPI00383B9FAB
MAVPTPETRDPQRITQEEPTVPEVMATPQVRDQATPSVEPSRSVQAVPQIPQVRPEPNPLPQLVPSTQPPLLDQRVPSDLVLVAPEPNVPTVVPQDGNGLPGLWTSAEISTTTATSPVTAVDEAIAVGGVELTAGDSAPEAVQAPEAATAAADVAPGRTTAGPSSRSHRVLRTAAPATRVAAGNSRTSLAYTGSTVGPLALGALGLVGLGGLLLVGRRSTQR